MIQGRCSNKIVEELRGFKSFSDSELEIIRERINWAYSIGFDTGRISRSPKKEVHQLDGYGRIIDTFDSAAHASRKLGIDESSIRAVCKGRRNKAGGFSWIRKEDSDKHGLFKIKIN